MMRNQWRWVLAAVSLGVSVGAGAVTQEPERGGGANLVRGPLPGRILLDPSPEATSYLCVPRAVLDELLCNTPDNPNTNGSEEVHLVIRRPSSNTRPNEVEARLFTEPGGSAIDGFSTSLPELGGDHVSQNCGAWTFRYDVPAAAFTKQAEVRLMPSSLDAGVFELDVWANANIVFQEVQTGREVSLPHPFIANFRGRYVIVPPSAAGPLQAAGLTNLLLFARREDSSYCPLHGCAVVGACGWACLEPAAEVFDLANPGGRQCARPPGEIDAAGH